MRQTWPAKRRPPLRLMVESSIGLTVSNTPPLSGNGKLKKNGPPKGRAPLRCSSLAFAYAVHCGVRYMLKPRPCFSRVTDSDRCGVAAETAATSADVLAPAESPF